MLSKACGRIVAATCSGDANGEGDV